MFIFYTDLDNTIIFSYKHNIGIKKRSVEKYQGREISFITERTYELLKQVREQVLLVPITTRTLEQYQRIDLGIGKLPYALVCNGGILLKEGQEEEKWYKESLAQICPAQKELVKAIRYLEADKRRVFEVRLLSQLFVFTKCEKPEEVVSDLKENLDTEIVDIFHNGIKVYVVPRSLSKGKAIHRFCSYLGIDQTIAAGDSEFDRSMFSEADFAIAPQNLSKKLVLPSHTMLLPEKKVYSEEVLEKVLHIVSHSLI